MWWVKLVKWVEKIINPDPNQPNPRPKIKCKPKPKPNPTHKNIPPLVGKGFHTLV